MRQIYTQIEQVSPTKTGVLIQGETGTGKELVVRASLVCVDQLRRDEITEMDFNIQAKLLGVLQERNLGAPGQQSHDSGRYARYRRVQP